MDYPNIELGKKFSEFETELTELLNQQYGVWEMLKKVPQKQLKQEALYTLDRFVEKSNPLAVYLRKNCAVTAWIKADFKSEYNRALVVICLHSQGVLAFKIKFNEGVPNVLGAKDLEENNEKERIERRLIDEEIDKENNDLIEIEEQVLVVEAVIDPSGTEEEEQKRKNPSLISDFGKTKEPIARRISIKIPCNDKVVIRVNGG